MNSSITQLDIPEIQSVERDSLLSWLKHLRLVFPPRHSLVVGAGHGFGPWVGFLKQVPPDKVTLVEADEKAFQQLQRAVTDHPQWVLCHRMIAPEGREATFHRCSVRSENGLLEPGDLTSLWPRIALRESIALHTIPLSALICELATPPDWLFIDCLPSTAILAEARDQISSVSLIVARTAEIDHRPDLSRSEVTSLLESLGFLFLNHEPARNPSSGHSLFIRDPKNAEQKLAECIARVEELREASAAARQKITALEKENSRLTADWQRYGKELCEISALITRYAASYPGAQPNFNHITTQLTLIAKFLRD